MNALERAWYGKSVWVWLLAPLAVVFWLVSVLRRWLFKRGFLSSKKPNAAVIVVGNISVGGNGKTPLVLAICQWLVQNQYRPGIVSRGYGGSQDTFPHHIGSKDTPKTVGDEPYLMSRRLNVPVVIDPVRSRGAEKLVQELNCDVIVSDDGLQHYALQRDIEIVVVDGKRRHGNGFLLPMGPLREAISRTKDVDFVVINGGQTVGQEVPMQLKPEALTNILDADNRLAPEQLDIPVTAIAGIGNPQRFFSTLQDLGIKPENQISFPDHHQFSASDFDQIKDSMLLMTEKDAVKCQSFAKPNWWYLPVEASLPESFLQALLNKLDSVK